MPHTILEEHLKHVCPGCRQEHDAEFFSHFTETLHYILGSCMHCGYDIELRRDDFGAGIFLSNGRLSVFSEKFAEKHVAHMRNYVLRYQKRAA